MKDREDTCLLCGSLIGGKYRILQEIGHGGMSRVYLAVNETVNRKWAIKELRNGTETDMELAKRGLLREIDMLKKLRHPGLPGIFDVVEEKGRFFLVMDYIQGQPLSERLEREGRQSEEQVVHWGMELCEVLGYLHAQSPAVIYRDMKPANIIEKTDGTLALIDFGTAREFKGGNGMDTVCLGTVGYAAPEQFGGSGETDARSDIYSLGATLYHLAIGQHPGAGMGRLQNSSRRGGIKERLSPGLEQIIRKCTRKDPRRRYQSCEELAHALQKIGKINRERRIVRGHWCYRLVLWIGVGIFCAGTAFYLNGVARDQWLLSGNGESENLAGDKKIFGVKKVRPETSKQELVRSGRYEQELLQAETYEDYHYLILRYPERTEAYLALVHSMISDLVLTREEAEQLNQLWLEKIIPEKEAEEQGETVIQRLSDANQEGYTQVCYTVGTSFLQFYEVNVDKDRYVSAKRWLKGAENAFPAAKSYGRIADCLELISQYQGARTVQVEKRYEEERTLWENVQMLRREASELKMVDDRLQVWTEIDHLINTNMTAFLEAASSEELRQFLSGISEEMQGESQIEIQQTVVQIQQRIEETIQKIESAGGNG
ncbi:serine/threonine-protein kinase [uncultured Eubacterium sp.]|uniref:serine/threonine protein kinase n=1 Tax=uncultured Eubacterium sp. TaxID=165185 RepID=UPI0025F0BE27|nr:serine/threonine-protein kinase [uncultured Eubacterium sp.]